MNREVCEHFEPIDLCGKCNEEVQSNKVISDQAQDFAKKKELTILFAFDILHCGWEMDFEGLVCRDKMGYNVLVVGDHASFQIQKNNDILKQKIKEYEKAIKQTRSALGWLETK